VSVDLAQLSAVAPWKHFANSDVETEADALERLRARMGGAYATSPGDEDLTEALAAAVEWVTVATRRIFVATPGRLTLDSEDVAPGGSFRLFLPLPVVAVSQGGTGVTLIEVGDAGDTDELDAGDYTVRDGYGIRPNDPRDHPWIDLRSPSGLFSTPTSRGPEDPAYGSSGTWGPGIANVHVTAEWGYVDANGLTPRLARRLIALVTARELVDLSDDCERGDLRAGAVAAEAVEGRSITMVEGSAGGGPTGDREIDSLVAALRLPPQARTSQPPRRVRKGLRRR